MTYLIDNADRSPQTSGFDFSELDRIDRILLGSSAAVWLAALGAGVAAIVALVDLSGGHTVASGESGTPWILYTVIGVSAAVIVAAVPLLLRARRAALAESAPESQAEAASPKAEAAAPESEAAAPESQAAAPKAPVPEADAPTEKLRVTPAAASESDGSLAAEPHAQPAAAIDQLWLRCSAGIACAMGLATLLIAVSTYLMAVGSDTVAWVPYGIAGAITLGMVAIPWYALRELRVLQSTEAD
ncbi:MAG: DUF2561 family protein [Actinomycetia bacterium]|nr:DUF2561 family protein [Actinomycetes bacterium]